MKILLSTFILVFAMTTVHGQKLAKEDKKELKIAYNYISEKNYSEAYDVFWELYELYPENMQVIYGVAICKLNKKGEEKSALPLLLSVQYEKRLKNFDFYIGQAYHVNHKLDEAITSYEKYKSSDKPIKTLEEIDRQIQMALKAKESIKNPRNVDIFNLGPAVNTESEESVPVLLPDGEGIFFTSQRKGGYSNEKDYTGNYYQDIYLSLRKNMKWQTPVNANYLNTKKHDVSVSMSHNGSTFITYKTAKGESEGNLYYSINNDTTWSHPKKFGSNINSEYQELSACLSPDENTLYFSSNRPGGYGGFDLYKVQKLPTGNWGKAMNLGPNINTYGNEDAPFMHADGKTLYFSSNGNIGMGGYDIYKSTSGANNIWTTPENLGFPINSVEHDIYFIIDGDKKNAYYSSERPGGFGKEDLYQIKMLDNISFQTIIKGQIFDKMKNVPMGAKVTLIDESTHKLNGVYQSNNGNGKFIMIVIPDNLYQVVVEAHGYESKVLHVSFTEDADELNELLKFELSKTTVD